MRTETSKATDSKRNRETVLPGTDPEFDSVSEIDQELLLGERRESDWKDARKDRANQKGSAQKPTLEDGAD